MVLRAEDLYREHAPSRAELQNVFFRLWTGASTAGADAAAFSPELRHKKNAGLLFEEEDIVPWTVFTLVFFILVIFDNFVLHRKAEKLSLVSAILYTTFWIAVAGMFNVYVLYTRGLDDAFNWGTGYLLEWMLSVDNLFVFHRIFTVFKTPDDQKHKPLFYGIMGAVVFRLVFFLIEGFLMHHVTWMHLVFGVFLIYTGIKAVSMDEEDDSPEKGWMYQFLTNNINYVDKYDDQGRFFTPVEVTKDADGRECCGTPRMSQGESVVVETQYRPSRLVLVVVCLEVTDLVFAVDSVSAIVAQIPDLFLAYTACVFAMLGLRAMFFAIDELVKMFSLLAYGVAFILIFIGCKLILRSWIHIPPSIVCIVLIVTLFLSVFASLLSDKFCDDKEDGAPEDSESPSARARY